MCFPTLLTLVRAGGKRWIGKEIECLLTSRHKSGPNDMNRTRRGKILDSATYPVSNTCTRNCRAVSFCSASLSVPVLTPGYQTILLDFTFRWASPADCRHRTLHGGAPHLPEQWCIFTPLDKNLLWRALWRCKGLYELSDLAMWKFGGHWYPQGPKEDWSPHLNASPSESLPIPIKIHIVSSQVPACC